MAGSISRRTTAIALAVVLAVALLNLALWLLYRTTRAGLEAELARRLEGAAALLGRNLDASLVETAVSEHAALTSRAAPAESLLVEPATATLRASLLDIADDTALANVRLFDRDGVLRLDLASFGGEGTAPPELDPAGVVAALAGGTAHSDLYQSGREYWMAGYAPVRDAFGEPIAAVAVEADARHFGALQRLQFAMAGSALLSALVLAGLGFAFARLQASLERAEAAMQRAETLAAMGRMAAGIAHEIRNPLGIIKATAARLRKRYDDPAHPDERFQYVDDEVDRLNAILTGYLQFARDEPPQLAPVDLGTVIERGLRLAAPELEAGHVDVVWESRPACTVRADATRLQQVVLNLVLNATQAMPGGGTLRLSIGRDAGEARLIFADTGPGFDAAVRERVFEPFVTTKANGSGLGLAVARRIVEQHGGSIHAGDAPGGGARVEIRLPLAATAEATGAISD